MNDTWQQVEFQHWAVGNLTNILKEILWKVDSTVAKSAFFCDMSNILFFWIKWVRQYMG